MDKAKELRSTQDIVKHVLETNPQARNSDDALIIAVCKRINPMCAGMSFETVMTHRKELGLPVLESIRRTGQKLRAAFPELAGCDEVEAHRTLNEEIFRDYAREATV